MKFLKAFETVIDEIISQFVKFGLIFISVVLVCYLITQANLIIKVVMYIWLVLVGFLATMKGIDKYQKLKIKELKQQIKVEKEKQVQIKKQIEDGKTKQEKMIKVEKKDKTNS